MMTTKRIEKIYSNNYWKYLQRKSNLTTVHIRQREDYEKFEGIWNGQPAFVISGSQAMKPEYFDFFRAHPELHTITVNHLIEDWDGSEFFLFSDTRFLDKTTYDLTKYKGQVLAKNNTHQYDKPLINKPLRYVPLKGGQEPSEKLSDGLYCNMCSGLAALNFAVIAGADPIYCLGMDGTTLDKRSGSHYKADYTGEAIKDEVLTRKDMYNDKRHKFFRKFSPYKNRIVNICDPEISIMKDKFTTITFNEMLDSAIWQIEKKQKTICHVGTLAIEKMGEITRNIFNMATGKHLYYNILTDTTPPAADIYLLHCFINHAILFENFNADGKIISLLHSDYDLGCRPSKYSNRTIVLTEAYKKRYGKVLKHVEVINAGVREYLFDLPMQYQKRDMVRICRNAPGKFHRKFDITIKSIIANYKNNFTLVTNKSRNNSIYIEVTDIEINDNFRKKYILSVNPIYIIANGDFEEVQSVALLEAMAAGCAIVCLHQNGYQETLGGAGIIASDMHTLKRRVEMLINSESKRIKYGTLARERVMMYSNSIMIKKYNKLFDSMKMTVS